MSRNDWKIGNHRNKSMKQKSDSSKINKADQLLARVMKMKENAS